jgi:valyl-tRNA synthetase
MDLDITEMEKKILSKWEVTNLKDLNKDAIKNGKVFSIDTPPPTVSGELHIGHAFSYPHQDIAARFFRMNGYFVLYPFGFDNNGLATERFVEKKMKLSLTNIPVQEAIAMCETNSKDAIEEMKKSFKKLAFSANFDDAYITYSKESWKMSQSFFIDMYKSKIAYRQEGMTVTCPTCRTAISQIEMEDKEMETDFVHIKFEDDRGKFIEIATTRPEMIGACVALAVNPSDNRAKEFKGRKFKVPIYNHLVELITDERVLLDKGTGAEMVCTFGDQNDYDMWKDHKLSLIELLDRRGFIRDNGPLEGMKVEEGRKKIKLLLQEGSYQVGTQRIKHSVNTHERCGTPIEIGVSQQWYLKYMDNKEKLKQQGREIRWIPDFMRIRYENWVDGLKWDWCISRQRIMGIPIPVWYCKDCGEILLPEKENLPVDPRFDPALKCTKCSSENVEPERDVLDTWFTSSTSPFLATKNTPLENMHQPMSARFQGHDIISTWAFTTIYRSMVHSRSIPWEKIIISGNVFDSKGQKMSKSKGNVVLPMDMVEKYGADGVRLWGTSSTTWDDISLKDQELVRGRRTVIKIFNAVKLVSSQDRNENVGDIKLPFNRWIMEGLNLTIEKTTNSYKNFDFARSRMDIDLFFWNSFCDNYLEIIKSYVARGTEEERIETSFVSRYVMTELLKLYAPIAPFITEEGYSMMGNADSIHSSSWPVQDRRFPIDYERFNGIISILDKIRSGRSKSKSARESYIGFKIFSPILPTVEEIRIIKETLREENLIFETKDNLEIEILK